MNEPIDIEAQVCADIASRQQLGMVKYGKSVADNPLAFREWLQHAYLETLDKAVYLKRAIAELDEIMGDYTGINKDSYPMLIAGRCETISQHAIDRYRERTGSKKSAEKIIGQLICRIANGKEMELLERFRVIELLAHGHHSRFFKDGDLMFVVENECVVTIHHGTADRWKPKVTPETPASHPSEDSSCNPGSSE